MSHILNLDDLLDYTSEKEIAGEHGKGKSKSLILVTRINFSGETETWFLVKVQGKVVKSNTSLETAIASYNQY